jgi:hypothetical protein
MKRIIKTIVILLTFVPVFSHAQVAQIVFITPEKTIESGQISEVITVQLQDESGNLFKTDETIDLVFTSSSLTGEFLSPASTTAVTLIMASGTANKNFRYKDSNAGVYIITVKATGRVSKLSWEASQSITVKDPIVTLPTISISGPVFEDVTWSPENGVYVLENIVTIPEGVTLTINPGTIIKGRHGGAGKLDVFGTLLVNGTEELPVYFTSFLDDEVGGDTDQIEGVVTEKRDWVGIYFFPDSVANFNHTVVRYAGYIGTGSNSGINNNGGMIDISNSTITDNYIRGIYQTGGKLVIADSTFENHFYGIQATAGEISIQNSIIRNNSEMGVDTYGSNSITLIGNTFSGNKKLGRVDVSAEFTHSDNTSTDLTNRGFVMSGELTENKTWHSEDLPLIIQSHSILSVRVNSTLTITPGTIIKFGSPSSIIVEGSLIIDGTNDSKVHLTSLHDDSIGGDTNGNGASSTPNIIDWGGVDFRDGSTGSLSHTIIQYTGGFNGVSNAAIYNLGGNVLLDNILFSNNFNNDIYQNAGSTTVSHSQFSSGVQYGVFNNGGNTVDARNNWWGAQSGPLHESNLGGVGVGVTDNVLFTPWIGRDPALPNPVLIVPGIMGTELLEDKVFDNVVWPSFSRIAISVTDDFLDVLKMNSNGDALNSNIIKGKLLSKIGSHDYWDSLITEINNHSDLHVFTYDWRKDLSSIVLDLKNKIEEVKNSTGADEVDIVAHSMGGLIFKKYLKEYGGNSVHKFLDIASPHGGAPSAFKILMYGDNIGIKYLFGIFNLNEQRIKIISQNMPSVYQLLPSENYFDESDPNYRYYVFNGINGNGRLTFEQTSDYMKDNGRNGLLIDRAKEFHREIDNLDPTTYGVRTYNIVGCGTPTIGQFFILDKKGDEYIYNIKMINGDGTVPLRSAEAMPATQTYYLKNAQHALMPSSFGVKELVSSILLEEEFSINSYPSLAMNSNNCQIPNGKLVSFHSPINFHIYDDVNNHAGPNENGDIVNNIPGVVYEVIENNKFAFLPEGVSYTVKGSATDTGTFDVRIQEIVNGEVATTTIFADIPLITTTQAQFDMGSNIPDRVYIDNDNDGVFENYYIVSTTTVGLLETTGRVATAPVQEKEVIDMVNQNSSGSFRNLSLDPGSVSVEEEVIEEVLGIAETTSLSIETQQVNAGGPEEVMEELDYSEEQYESAAVVYKSSWQKIVSFFKTIWAWIISKL